MVEKARRTADDTPRRTQQRHWEVFVREESDDPLRHVGAVVAPDPAVAHEEASKLFAWYARDVWICPADETHRFSTYSLAEAAATDPPTEGPARSTEESSVYEEPRVYEETEGTPGGRSTSK